MKRYALSILLPMILMAAVTYGVGRAILAWPTGEASVSRSLAAGRTPLWNTLTDFGSSLSDTPYIVALTAIAAIGFRLLYRRWRESIFLVAAVWGQSLIFLATTEAVGRHRPPVEHIDPAPPTSSFPSGHVSAAVAFYCGLALVLTSHVRNRALQVLIWALGIAAPLAVALSRLYRGMHFLSDVIWGALLGAGCVVMAARAILYARERRRRSELVRSA
ncbi:phosphatase PAP2 family protein [Nonomuraea angiospora]|uniref:Undecaprenyl-diphosphatase n=1 Tax=Nonomuraea angiospora TaxID=46172 RepID=A0ABR9LUT8_9ACTN|nr:phosphatase PAP2 family protein [Nonomuraea angiospora]MBE1583856.1 undecaprenyl-diphosphatase [Nonomuraea angiospora]MDX3107880.1 phosphatase PAP2 family protein [Nonomuraea angiospora]